jgi:hypothetical protein
MRSMAGRWSDEHIAASLNRMGLPTGQGKTWTAKRVSSVRRVRDIHAYRSAEKNGEWLTLTEAAKAAGVSSHMIRRLIKTGTLRARHRTSISGTIKLNGIFKMVCASVCWIFPERDESCIRDGLHAFGRQAEIPTWPN